MGPVGRLVENAARGMLPTLSFATFASASKSRRTPFACCGGATDSKFASARRFAATAAERPERLIIGEQILRTPSNPHTIRPF